MRKLLFFIGFILFNMSLNAQEYPFDKKWKEVETLSQEGKFKSLKPLVDDIYINAKKLKATDDLIKALIYQSNIAIVTSDNEDIALEVRDNFIDAIEENDGVEKAVLQSLLAKLYFNFYQENYYQFSNRSELAENSSEDFRTWSTGDFLHATDSLLQASLHDKKSLFKTNLQALDILLEGDDSFRHLQPTTYDILAKSALKMYENSSFEAQAFDQQLRQVRMEQIYSDALRLHQNDKDKSAFIQYKLEQLHFFADIRDDFDLIEELQELYNQFVNEPSTNILATMASELQSKEPVAAVLLCKLAQNKYPNSFGAKRCKAIQARIEQPEISINTDGTFFANQPNPLNITHKNADQLYYRVYKLSKQEYAKNINGFEYDWKSKKIKIQGDLVKQDILPLKKFDDYKSHTTHIPFEPLAAGNYVILMSINNDFTGTLDKELFQAAIQSTAVDVAVRFPEGQLLNKATGLPIKNELVQVYTHNRDNTFTNKGSVRTDEFGRFKIKPDHEHYYNYFIQTSQESTVHAYGRSYGYHNRQDVEVRQKKIKYFSDRAIYRPGQTVYFKGILYKKIGKENQIVTNQKIEITLIDPNYEDVAKIELTSNEFGSIHGEFVLPTSGITGIYQFEDDWSESGYLEINVEEYKRPKFKVELDTLKGIYTLSKKVHVSGNAKTFSGANVSNADVSYRVVRKEYNPYRWWWGTQNSEEVEITNGEIITDANGEFQFDFIAKPDTDDEIGKRAYTYTIYTVVTDVSGETHTAESSIRIGDIPLTIRIDTEDRISVDDFENIQIITQNLNGENTNAEGTLTISKIEKLDRVLRDEQIIVDYEVLDKADFVSKLPYIAYDNEHLTEKRDVEKVALQQEWSTKTSDTIHLNKKLKAGIYKIEAISLYENDTVQSQRIIELFNPEKTNIQNTYFSVQKNKETYQPGDYAELTFVSDAEDAHAIVELEVNGEIQRKEILKLNNTATYKFPIIEEYRGGVFVHVYFNKFNESISKYIQIPVPYENKQLDIEVATLRNKLEPGVAETWELTIKDKKGDRFLSEVLASMYDKSLDEFAENPYSFDVFYNNNGAISNWSYNSSTHFRRIFYRDGIDYPTLQLEQLNLFGLTFDERRSHMMMRSMAKNVVLEDAEMVEAPMAVDSISEEVSLESVVIAGYAESNENSKSDKHEDLSQVPIRKNLQETAFFYPNLTTDKDGNVKISFTSPEALTTWNFQAVVHTKDLKTGVFQSDIVTQKELMVVPNAPRFLRENDQLNLTTKIINLSDKTLSGDVQMVLLDAFTMQPIEGKFNLTNATQPFNVDKGGNTAVTWSLDIPTIDEVKSVIYRVVAKSGAYSDGEENALPILTNRTLVTETMPIHIRENQSKIFTLDKLKNTTSASRENFKLTMEMTTQPIWYAVMALPYLREYPYECSEQIFARLYGNLISQSIVNSNPKIKAVFDDWNAKGELISPLEKNQELKNILLEESPWLRSAQSESEQMKRISVLFDLNQMRNELQGTYRKLAQKQSGNGGFPWFEGGRESVYITTHIVAGFGHLEKMGIPMNTYAGDDLREIPLSAIDFIDAKMLERWNKYQSDKERYALHGFDGLYWLYARSYFLEDKPLQGELLKAKDYFLTEMEKKQFEQGLHVQGLLALTLQRFGHAEKAQKLLNAIKERSVVSDEMGMYWKENVSGYRWNETPVETQALIIEAFDEILPNDVQSVEDMKVWLLKNKQTNQWSTTKATTEAVYALMNSGKDWMGAEEGTTVTIGGEVWLSPTHKPNSSVQSGSGYVKTSWDKDEITPSMATVEVTKTSPGVAWGAMYWQYFEDLNKITSANTDIRFNKQLFIQKNTPQGPRLVKITENEPIQIGDLVKVRLEIQTDRAMEFVHIKDMRASGFEPVNVLSRYKWQDGLGYYESTRDAATNFFVDYMPKGVYVFEYEVRANNSGHFSNGITQMQNMYAPEFSAHSDGIDVVIE